MMRRSSIIITLILVLLSTNLQGSGLVGGGIETFTTLSVPSSINDGQNVTISTTTNTSSGGIPPLGAVNFIIVNDEVQIGPNDDGSTISADLPVIRFLPHKDFTLYGIHIPITTIANFVGNSIAWSIHDNPDENSLISGDINVNDANKMISDGNLLITLGTIQTEPENWTSGFNLSAWNPYYLKLSSVSATFHFPASTTSSSLIELFDNTTSLLLTPKINIYSGYHLGEASINATGQASVNYTASIDDQYVIAQYGDAVFSSPSHDFVSLNVTNPIYVPPETPDNSTEPEDTPTDNGGDEEIIVVVPPENNNDNFTDPNPSNNTDIPTVDDFKDQIPGISTDSGFNVREYLDMIAIAGIQLGTSVRKIKK